MNFNWKLGIIFVIGIVGVSLRDHFDNWMKILWIVVIIGGCIFSALTSDSTSKNEDEDE